MDQSDSGSAGVFTRWTNQIQEARVYSHDGPIRFRKRGYIHSHDGPIRFRKRGYIHTMDQSDSGSAVIFARWTNQIQEA
eukprot:1188645-Prorocentrum_minimum.AAC.1